MTKKELYTSPEVDVFTLQSEGVICQSDTDLIFGNPGEPGGVLEDGGLFIF